MQKKMKELQKLKGVGETMSRRFVEAGYDTYARIAAAGDEGLKKVQGLNPRMIQSITAQAQALVDEAQKSKTEIVAELKQKTASLKEHVQEIALAARVRYKNEISGNVGRKLEKEVGKVISSLKRVEGKLERRVKKAGKGLLKAEKRLACLADVKLKDIGKGLKKARNSLKRGFA